MSAAATWSEIASWRSASIARHSCSSRTIPIKASVCYRVADHIAADDTEDEPVAERRERLLTALELYQSAERDYYRAIGAGAYYYDRRLDEVIAAEERMRTEFLRR